MSTDDNDLERLAQRLAGNPTFFAHTLANYQRQHQLDDAGLAARLGCGMVTLLDLRLCRRPADAEDVERIAFAFNLDVASLAQVAAITL